MVFKKKKPEFEKGHDMTIGEILQLTEYLDGKLGELGLCSHQISAVGMFLMHANSMGDIQGGVRIGGLVTGKDMKDILKNIADTLNDRKEKDDG